MPKALLYIKEEILKLHQIAEEGQEAKTAEAARSFLFAMGMNLPLPEDTPVAKVSRTPDLVCSMPVCSNSMSNAESSTKSHLSSASTQRCIPLRNETAPCSFATIKHHCKNPAKARMEKHQSYGSTEEVKAPLLNSSGQGFNLPESLKMGVQCNCPICKFMDEKAKDSTKKVDYYCCCCPVYKNVGALEEESKQDFVKLHQHLDTFLDQILGLVVVAQH